MERHWASVGNELVIYHVIKSMEIPFKLFIHKNSALGCPRYFDLAREEIRVMRLLLQLWVRISVCCSHETAYLSILQCQFKCHPCEQQKLDSMYNFGIVTLLLANVNYWGAMIYCNVSFAILNPCQWKQIGITDRQIIFEENISDFEAITIPPDSLVKCCVMASACTIIIKGSAYTIIIKGSHKYMVPKLEMVKFEAITIPPDSLVKCCVMASAYTIIIKGSAYTIIIKGSHKYMVPKLEMVRITVTAV